MKLKVLISLLLVFSSQTLWAGHSVGNGGDMVAAQFTEQARKAIYAIPRNQPALVELARDLRWALNRTTVRSAMHVYLDKLEVDAANYPKQGLIVVNISRWRPRADHAVLTLHEYLWIAGYDDSTYELSQRLARLSAIPVIIPVF